MSKDNTAGNAALTLAAINQCGRAEFVAALGQTFEHSPWVVERAWEARPFASLAALHAAMVEVIRQVPESEQIALLRAHPDLAGKEAVAGLMTDSSTAEQASAGLNALSAAEVARIAQLNGSYRARHGFPFIIAVRQNTRQQIFAAFESRLQNETGAELAACLEQVFIITRLRLEQSIAG